MVKKICNNFHFNILALQETKLEDNSKQCVKQICGFLSASFLASNAVGMAGGQLLIWNDAFLAEVHSQIGRFFILANLAHLCYNKICTFINIYGPPNRANRPAFFQELKILFSSIEGSVFITGDFNVTRGLHERRNCTENSIDSSCFSQIFAYSNLIDLPIAGLEFTWSNNQTPPSLAKLDHCLISKDASSLFPLVTALGGERILSDHNAKQIYIHTTSFYLRTFWFKRQNFRHI
ncbi:hypothetical protein Cni_G06850 [Canna indica]|uniref:Endonuclease/exonuclease/phosphatase domain-containing protein n=1 Tax=Canna indica TaxID=4628 RepID=A0AAQ3Q6D7_9LILI|nr:hypothetical protein Cni_G06850 [Canna indica]